MAKNKVITIIGGAFNSLGICAKNVTETINELGLIENELTKFKSHKPRGVVPTGYYKKEN